MTPTRTKLNSKPPGVRQDNKVFCEFVAKAKDHLLKGEADRELCSLQCHLLKEVVGSRFVMEKTEACQGARSRNNP
jgi:hypothetical protein